MSASYIDELLTELDNHLRESFDDVENDPELKELEAMVADRRRHATARPPRREQGQ